MSDSGIFTALLLAFLDRTGKARVVEKTPVHLRHVDDILACLPHARIIWILRDGRGCIASLRRVNWASHDIATLSHQWTRNMAFGLHAKRRHVAKVLITRYEDLTAQPQAEITRILEWVSEPFSEATLDTTQETTTISDAEESWKGNVHKPIQSDRAEAWRKELAADQVLAAEAVMGPMLRRLGYDAPVANGLTAKSEQLRQFFEMSSLGIALQKRLFDFRASRRFAPWGANRGTRG